jgi:hypothetical protein
MLRSIRPRFGVSECQFQNPCPAVDISTPTDRLSRWTQGLALLLVAVIGLQGVPLQTLIHSVQHAASHHKTAHHGCTHPQGVCPMNPDGPCQCNHDDTSPTTDGPVFEGCNIPTSAVLQTATRGLWIAVPGLQLPPRRSHLVPLIPRRSSLSSQRTGDDVFHPPRHSADVRPAAPLQAPVSA